MIRSKATGAEHWVEAASLRPILRGRNIRRYEPITNDKWLVLPYTAKGKPMDEQVLSRQWPKTYAYLESLRILLEHRASAPKRAPWYALSASRNFHRMGDAKLLTGWKPGKPQFTFDRAGEFFFINIKGAGVIPKEESGLSLWALLGVLNSAATQAYIELTTPQLRGNYVYNPGALDALPLAPLTTATRSLYARIEGPW